MNEHTVSGKSSHARRVSMNRRVFMGVVGVGALGKTASAVLPSSAVWVPTEGPNQPMGEGQGLFPGRVVWMHNPQAATWDGDAEQGSWCDDKWTNPVLADQMLSKALELQTGAASDTDAWAALFRHYNRTHGRPDAGYRPGEKVVVKLNLNCSQRQTNSPPGLYNTPQMTKALLRQLVHRAGIPQTNILVCDASRLSSDTIFDACRSDFPDIRFEDRDGGQERIQARPDKNVALHFGDPHTRDSGKTYLPASITAATYLINVALLKGHRLAGVTLCAKNHFGSVYRDNAGADDPHRGWNPSHMHDEIMVRDRAMGTYNPLVDLMGHRHLGGKTVLYMLDALYAAPHQNAAPQPWQSSPFDGHWTASLFVSQDPVAIDSVAVDFFAAEQTAKEMIGSVDNYLHEAALADNAPSKTRYAPEGTDATLPSLGVHEHWNNSQQKQYSRNLGLDQGIELVQGP
ncbi:MAG: DUF362 domain-containing protein [Pirellulaceae bacterium]